MRLVNKYKLFFLRVLALLFATSLVACSGDKKKEITYVERDLNSIYENALSKLKDNDFEEAVAEFDEVERQHPYSVWARKSIIMSSYASYKDRDFIKAEIINTRSLAIDTTSLADIESP